LLGALERTKSDYGGDLMSSDTLQSTVALVSGASSRIGRAAARRLATEGATVALVARRGDRLKELAAETNKAGGVALGITADLTDADAYAKGNTRQGRVPRIR
jgi:NADP-dependent 3-hydroxy acid dehydrogenase YdfG